MIRRWPGRAAGAVLAFAALVAAAAGEVAVPPLAARVTDLTATLSAEQRDALERRLREFERSRGSQIAVLMLPTTQPETIEQYSIRVAEAWKIGRARVDDGLILVVAKNDQRLRIEVGRGLEGAIPDVLAGRVIREVIAPHFLAGDFHGGIADGTRALMKLIEGERLPAPAARASPRGTQTDTEPLLVTLLVMVLVFGRILTALVGRAAGSSAVALLAGGAAWLITGALAVALIAGVLAFVFALGAGGGRGVFPGRGFGGGWGGGGFGGGGGGFGGGGGGFGGGGASGGWGR